MWKTQASVFFSGSVLHLLLSKRFWHVSVGGAQVTMIRFMAVEFLLTKLASVSCIVLWDTGTLSQNVCAEKALMKHNGANDSEINHLSQSHYCDLWLHATYRWKHDRSQCIIIAAFLFKLSVFGQLFCTKKICCRVKVCSKLATAACGLWCNRQGQHCR